MRRPFDLACALLFASGLAATLVDAWVRPERLERIRGEERSPVQFPTPPRDARDCVRWTGAFERWFGDHLGLRDRLLELRGRLLVQVFGRSPAAEIVIGAGGDVFLAEARALETARGARAFTAAEIGAWVRVLELRAAWCRERGIEHVVAVAPDKSTVYRDRLPARYERIGPTRLEQLGRRLREVSALRFLDLSGALQAERALDRDDERAYYRLGTHWTERGAFAAYEAIARELARSFPSVVPLARESLVLEESQGTGDTWAGRLYLDDVWEQRTYVLAGVPAPAWTTKGVVHPLAELVETELDDARLPSAIVFHDSFAQPLRASLPRHFRRSTWMWKHAFDYAAVERLRPDVVVELYCEHSFLGGSVPPLPPLGADDLARSFERGASLMRVDASTRWRGIRQVGDLAFDTSESELLVQSRRSTDVFELAEVELPSGADLAVAIDVTSQARTTLDVLFKTRARPEYARTNLATVQIEEGRHVARVRLAQPDLFGPLRVRLGTGSGAFLVHSIELFALPK